MDQLFNLQPPVASRRRVQVCDDFARRVYADLTYACYAALTCSLLISNEAV